MAYKIGFSNNYIELSKEIVNFAQLNNWAVLRDSLPVDNPTIQDLNDFNPAFSDLQVALESPSGAKVAFVLKRGFFDAAGSDAEYTNNNRIVYNWFELNCFTEWNSSNHVFAQEGSTPITGFNGVNTSLQQPIRLSVASSNLKYFIFVNDLRIIVVVRSDNKIYGTMHLGYLKAYTSDLEYPNPLFCGGNLLQINSSQSQGVFAHNENIKKYGYDQVVDWPTGQDSSQNMAHRVMLPGGTWAAIRSNDNYTLKSTPIIFSTNDSIMFPSAGRMRHEGQGVDGSYSLYPITLQAPSAAGGGFLGEVDGAFAVSGENNLSENIIEVGGRQFIVFSASSLTLDEYFYALEMI